MNASVSNNPDPFGPSDSSDSASDRPGHPADSDAPGTGERASADLPTAQPEDAQDIDIDQEVNADDAGLARTPPDPERNGGLPPASGHSLGGEIED
ncbi:MatE family transporter [Bordetella sp. 02P26C-1]|uniref:MatE family transporter n=1 Tax=Bordetella sp. 02P26C-1 TaxID=2683195 RepID=UPI0013543963|nr:MatE family transporter [Bordetella sp. 02P26C-1]MVW79874.1 MatE family transporter [Bordetella sp. 02P26C-1]